MRAKGRQETRVTLRDVAESIGVSIGTASVVLNGSRSGSHISSKTREALIDAASQMRYRPSRIARSLLGGSTRTIGIVPSSADRDLLLGPHLLQAMNSAANVLEEHGFDLLLLTRCDQSKAEDIMLALLDGRVDGAILVSPRSDSCLVERLCEEHLPFVVIDGEPEPGVDAFRVDDVAGIGQVLDHLNALGHKRIAHISGTPTLQAATRRKRAFVEGMERAGLEVAPEYLQSGGFGPGGGQEAMRALLELPAPPTAVVCANDEAAMEALSEARARGLQIPRDISVTGFDDVPLARFSEPALTTVRHPMSDIASAAATALFHRLSGHEPQEKSLFPCELVVRNSTSTPLEGTIQ